VNVPEKVTVPEEVPEKVPENLKEVVMPEQGGGVTEVLLLVGRAFQHASGYISKPGYPYDTIMTF
jgi:hypothetical protein